MDRFESELARQAANSEEWLRQLSELMGALEQSSDKGGGFATTTMPPVPPAESFSASPSVIYYLYNEVREYGLILQKEEYSLVMAIIAFLMGDAEDAIGRVDRRLRRAPDIQRAFEAACERQNFNCAADGCDIRQANIRHLTADHIIPVSKGGTDDADNIQALCYSCNAIKGDRDMDYLRAQLKDR